MKQVTKHIEVSSSYHVRSYSEKMEPTAALAAMRSDGACLYHSASRNDDFSVTLTRTNIICPYCNYVHPLQTHHQIMRKHIDVMEKWSDLQRTLFDQELEKEIAFFSTDLETFSCPRCGYSSDCRKNSHTTITTVRKKNKVIIRCEIKDLLSILALPHLPEAMFGTELPLYEQIEFNFGRGRVCVRILTENDRAMHTVDVTNDPRVLSKCELTNWFYKIEAVRQIIAEMIKDAAQTDLPFELQDITLEDLVFFTRFIGYGKEFYDAIPYDKETLVIDKSFLQLQRLHTQKEAIDYVSSFSLAKYKSIRKQIFERSGLLFYLPECESLYCAIGDVNVFKSILECKYAFDILLTFHQHPISMAFFRDYCKMKGAAGLYRRICSKTSSWYELRCYMLYYCSLSQYSQSVEKKKWKGKRDHIGRIHSTGYSLPMICKTPKEANCEINGFTFKLLRNTSECFRAGRELNNCLQSWESFGSPVITVSQANEIVAAIEISDNTVTQAYSYENLSIDHVFGLSAAIEKWAKQNKITFSK